MANTDYSTMSKEELEAEYTRLTAEWKALHAQRRELAPYLDTFYAAEQAARFDSALADPLHQYVGDADDNGGNGNG